MPVRGGNPRITIQADAQPVDQAVNQAEKSFDRLGAAGARAAATLRTSSGHMGVSLRTGLSGLAGIAGIAGIGVGAAFAKSMSGAIDVQDANNTLKAQLGLNAKESAQLGRTAGKLYASNYGDSLEQVNVAIRSVVTDIDGMRTASSAQLQGITGDVLSVSKAFDQDLGGVTRAVGQLMRTGLAKDAREALNVVTVGFQAGDDRAGDFLDTLNEYGTQFRKLGIDGKTATGLISQGLKNGARDSDLVADSLKEFSIRAVDGSKTTKQGFEAIGLSAGKMSEQIAKGGKPAEQGLDKVLDRLRKIKDPVKQSQAAVALFGTQAEDLGKALYALDPSNAVKGLKDVDGAARKVSTTMGSGAKAQFAEFKRQIETTGTTLASKVVPYLASGAKAVNTFITGMKDGTGAGGRFAAMIASASGHLRQIITDFRNGRGGAVALGAGIAGLATAVGVFKVITLGTKAWAAAQLALNIVMDANPVGLFITGIAGLAVGLTIAYKKSETFRDIVNGAFGVMKAVVLGAIGAIKDVIAGFATALRTYVGIYKTAAKAIGGAIVDGFSFVKSIPGKIGGWFKDGVTKITSFETRAFTAAQDLGGKIVGGIKNALGTLGQKILDGLKSAWDWAKSHFHPQVNLPFGIKIGGKGDGIGKILGSSLAGGTFRGGLHGADSRMAPFARIASGFGLGISAGRDDHSKYTTSGNLSFHGSGEALDFSNGYETPQEMSFARYMVANYGGRLAELIYTPLGFSIKDGRRVSPIDPGQHHDHVHVAFDLGRPGVGDGLGKFTATSYGPPWGGIQGSGVTATGVNLKGNPHMYGVAVDPKVIPLGSKLKITPNPFGYSGTFTAFDTGGAIKGNRIDFYDWRGRAAQNGWGRESVRVELVTDATGNTKAKTYKPGVSNAPVPSFTITPSEAPDPSSLLVPHAPRTVGGITGAFGPAKGGRPIKGYLPGDLLPADAPEGPDPYDTSLPIGLQSAAALARLTKGTDDDLAAEQSAADYLQGKLNAAIAGGDPQGIATFANALADVKDSIDSLTDSMTQANALQQQRDADNAEIIANQTKLLALGNRTGDLQAQFAAWLSGSIGGRVGLGFQAAGVPGSVARY